MELSYTLARDGSRTMMLTHLLTMVFIGVLYPWS